MSTYHNARAAGCAFAIAGLLVLASAAGHAQMPAPQDDRTPRVAHWPMPARTRFVPIRLRSVDQAPAAAGLSSPAPGFVTMAPASVYGLPTLVSATPELSTSAPSGAPWAGLGASWPSEPAVIPDAVMPEPSSPAASGAYSVFFYSGYCQPGDTGSLPSAYGGYPGLPGYIAAPATIAYLPAEDYVGSYIPFSPSDYNNQQIRSLYDYYAEATTDNPMLYHGPTDIPGPDNNQAPAQAPSAQVPAPAQPAPEIPAPDKPAYPSGSYKEAFADIQAAWESGDIAPIRQHLPSHDQSVSVWLKGKYAYSIAASNWADITRDAIEHLQTISFQFTVLRFARNGDMTGYATHVYVAASKNGDTPNTMYVSYTLRHRAGLWYVISVDTSPQPLIAQQAPQQ